MNVSSCERVREVLPELIGGRLDADERARAEEHLRGCAQCRAERYALTLVAGSRPVVPAGLAERVVAATRVGAAAQRRWGSGQLAMAATLAAAVIGGALLIDAGGLRRTPNAPRGDSGAAVLLPAVVDPLLQGSLLPELTEAELEALLKEMDS